MKKALFLGITLFCLYFATRGLDWGQFWAVVSVAERRYLLAAVAFLIASYLIRALRWFYLFPFEARQKGLHYLFPTLMIGYFANNFLPERAGELARVILMGRHNKISRAGVLSTIVAERTFDGLLLSLVGFFALQQVPLDRPWIQQITLAFCGLFLTVLVLGLSRGPVKEFSTWFSARFPGHMPASLTKKLQSMLDYLEGITTGLGLLRIVLLTSLIWFLELFVYAFVARGFEFWLQPFQLGIFLVTVNFASLLPTSPGGIGIIELAATEVLVLSGVERETAFAMVVTQHALQFLFCLLVGFYYTRHIGFSLRGIPAALQSRALLDVDDLVGAQIRTYPEAVRHYQSTAPKVDFDSSMVIPAYNEQARILPTLLSVTEYFNHTGFSHEVIVVDDGSQDDTSQLVQELGKRFPSIRLIRLPHNMGKGAAVRTGIRNATGNYILFNDADGATPVQEMGRLLAAMEQGAHVAIGSRALYSPETHIERTWGRAVAGRIFAFLVNAWVLPGIADTQCGFKMFRRDVAHRIFGMQQLDGFAFDVEVLRIASLLGYRIVEVPINWTNIKGSKVRLFLDSLRMVRDVIFVRYLVPNSLRAVCHVTEAGAAQKFRLSTDTGSGRDSDS
jgi:dolichyl-phosphate beta-glucosyltransferase